MKRLLIAALAAGLAATAPSLADNRHGGAGHPAMAHPAPRAQVSRPAAHFEGRRPSMAHRAMSTSTHRAAHHAAHATVGRHPGRFAKVRRATHATRRFHAGIYHRPHGWYARHWR